MAFDIVFDFERESVKAFQCIPLAVRYKLDLCGVKLSRRQWRQFTDDDRRDVLRHRCETEHEVMQFRDLVTKLIASRTGEEAVCLPIETAPAWAGEAVPDQLVAYSKALGIAPLSEHQWRALTVLQRFSLVKLSGEGHDNENFVPALRAFELAWN